MYSAERVRFSYFYHLPNIVACFSVHDSLESKHLFIINIPLSHSH